MTAAMPLPIKTAAELADADLEARAAARPEIRPDVLRRVLGDLNDDDLLVLREDAIELAYPFSAAPTRFVARRAGGRERFICCAIDALGLAPMLGEPVQIASACHHCDAPLRFAVGPDGPGPEARDLMVWITRSGPDEGRACAVL